MIVIFNRVQNNLNISLNILFRRGYHNHEKEIQVTKQ